MTATAPQNAYSLVQQAPDIRVYRAPRAEFFGAGANAGAKTWTRLTHLKVEKLRLTSGAQPAEAVLRQDLGPSDARVATPNNLESVQDMGVTSFESDALEAVPTPLGWHRWDAVRICLASSPSTPDESESCVYVGFLEEWDLSLETGQVWLRFADARQRLAGIRVWGERWLDETTTPNPNPNFVFLQEALPVFNPKGKGNLYQYAEDAPAGQNLAFVDEHAALARFWKRGHIWNYLRRLHSTNPESGFRDGWETASTAAWLDWPEAKSGGFGKELFAQNSLEASAPQWAIGGMRLDEAINTLIRKREDLDWTVTYDGSTGRAAPKIYGTGAVSMNQASGRKSFRWGDVAKTPTQLQAEVPGGRLTCTAAKTATVVRGLGARKLLDITFDTVASTLEQASTATERTAWAALFDDEDAECSRKYPNVFRRWRVPLAYQLGTLLFGQYVNLLRKRTAAGFLQSYDAEDKALRIRCLVWRSKTGGASWELCPEEMRPSIADGCLGIDFPEGARHEREWSEFEDAETWTWDGNGASPTAYDIRVTLSVEADARLVRHEGYRPSGAPIIEDLLQDEGYVYRARREAWLLVDASGNVSRNGTTPALKGSGADEMVYPDAQNVKDEDRLGAAVYALASQRCRVGWSGNINLKGLRTDVQVGDYVERLRAGGSGGARPDVPLGTVVRAVSFHPDPSEAITSVQMENY